MSWFNEYCFGPVCYHKLVLWFSCLSEWSQENVLCSFSRFYAFWTGLIKYYTFKWKLRDILFDLSKSPCMQNKINQPFSIFVCQIGDWRPLWPTFSHSCNFWLTISWKLFVDGDFGQKIIHNFRPTWAAAKNTTIYRAPWQNLRPCNRQLAC